MPDDEKPPRVPEEIFEIHWEVNQGRGIIRAELLVEIQDALIEAGHTEPAMSEKRCCGGAGPR